MKVGKRVNEEQKQTQHLHFQSRLGFILLAVGCAIGLGNIWRFPYMVYQNGGAIFVAIYLLCLVLIGLPVMLCEFAVGRKSQSTCIKSFTVLQAKPTYKWPWVGYLALTGCVLLLSYYAMIAGWMLDYVANYSKDVVRPILQLNTSALDPTQVFTNLLADPIQMFTWTTIILFVCALICSLGFNKGVEKLNKVMMSVLFVILLLLALVSLNLPGAKQAMQFYLLPNFEQLHKVGLVKVIFAALNQAFFTLSLGVSAMAIFASRIGKEKSLLHEAMQIGILDTIVALLAGVIIFPAAFTFNISADAGPNLVFVTLPRIFQAMPYGNYFAVLFFLFMTFAALSTVLAVFENIISCVKDIWNCSRRTSIALTLAVLLLLNVPNIFGFNVLKGFKPFAIFDNVMDLTDYIVSANILPLGSLLYVTFCCSKLGMGFKAFRAEVNQGSGLKIPKASEYYFKFVLPLLIVVVYLMALIRAI